MEFSLGVVLSSDWEGMHRISVPARYSTLHAPQQLPSNNAVASAAASYANVNRISLHIGHVKTFVKHFHVVT
jgi:hypothetical protein